MVFEIEPEICLQLKVHVSNSAADVGKNENKYKFHTVLTEKLVLPLDNGIKGILKILKINSIWNIADQKRVSFIQAGFYFGNINHILLRDRISSEWHGCQSSML